MAKNQRSNTQIFDAEKARQAFVKASFADEITELIALNIADRTERISAITAVTDAYIDSMGGETPEPAQLERLTDYILREELTDPDPYKVAHNEYPFFSDWQLDLRRDREVSLKAAEETGTDGRDYTVPTRRRRSTVELLYVDHNAKVRNRERAIQYRKDTATIEYEPYNLRDTGGEFAPEFTQSIGIGQRWRDSLSITY